MLTSLAWPFNFHYYLFIFLQLKPLLNAQTHLPNENKAPPIRFVTKVNLREQSLLDPSTFTRNNFWLFITEQARSQTPQNTSHPSCHFTTPTKLPIADLERFHLTHKKFRRRDRLSDGRDTTRVPSCLYTSC